MIETTTINSTVAPTQNVTSPIRDEVDWVILITASGTVTLCILLVVLYKFCKQRIYTFDFDTPAPPLRCPYGRNHRRIATVDHSDLDPIISSPPAYEHLPFNQSPKTVEGGKVGEGLPDVVLPPSYSEATTSVGTSKQ